MESVPIIKGIELARTTFFKGSAMRVAVSSLKVLTLLVCFFWFQQSFAQGLAMFDMDRKLGCSDVYRIQKMYIQEHIYVTSFSKKIEDRTVDLFIKQLDPQKLYLLESDISKLKSILSGVIDKVKVSNCSPLHKAYDYYKEKVKNRVDYVSQVLSKNFKLNKDTELVLDPKFIDRPKTIQQARKAHDKYLQFQVANYVANKEPLSEGVALVLRSYERLLKRTNEFDSEKLYSLFLNEFASSLDPHSSYFSADALKDFRIQMSLSLEGIGATLSSKDGFTVVEQLIPGGAAIKSGKLKPKDKIIAVAQGEDGKSVNVMNWELREVVKLIRGEKGTLVKLTLLRKDDKETRRFDVALTREKIKLEDEAASLEMIERDIKIGAETKKKKVALVELPSFYSDGRKNGRRASTDLIKVIDKAKLAGAEAMVLDLSTNGGGSLDEAVKIAGLFFATGNVVKQSQRPDEESVGFTLGSDNTIPLADIDPTVYWAGPLVILVSRISASASEIVAGTLKDYRRAIIVGGDHTFGKGSVQQVKNADDIGNLGAVKTTVGMFFTAGGLSTQHRGVSSDIVFPSVYSTEEIGEKNLDYSLPFKKVRSFLSKSAYKVKDEGAWKLVTPKDISTLKAKAVPRVKGSEEFTKIVKEIEKSKKRGKVIKISEFLADKEEDSKENGTEDEVQTPEKKREKYLKRADIQEAATIAAELSELEPL